MRVAKKIKPLQSPAVTINDRLYVPLRDITEGLGLECYWHNDGLIIVGETAVRTAEKPNTVENLLNFYQNIDLKK